MTSHSPSTIYAARSVVHVVAVAGDLDDNTAADLIHSCDCRLHQLDIGDAPLTHIVIDVSTVHNASPTAIAVLDLARVEAERRGVGLHLAGLRSAAVVAASHDGRRFDGFPMFPDLATALATLDPEHHRDDPARRAVDPDALAIDAW